MFNNFYFYTFFNYFDKFLNFLIPFLILRIFQNEIVYAQIEYIIALSLMLLPLLDFGLKSYSFYFYSRNLKSDKAEVISSFRRVFYFIILFLFLFSFIILFMNYYLIFYALYRALFMSFITVEGALFRILDKNSKIFLYSIPVNVFSIFIIFYYYYFNLQFNIWAFVVPYIFFIFVVIIFYFREFKFRFTRSDFNIWRSSIRYSWPIVFTFIFASFQNNYIKVYGYDLLSLSDYNSISILLRFFVILILAHSSGISFFTKDIFINKSFFSINIFTKYISVVLVGYFMVIFFINISNHYNFFKIIEFDYVFYLVSLYFGIMLIRSYIEIIYAKTNFLIYIFFISFFVFIVFILFAFLLNNNFSSLENILYIMIFSEFLFLLGLLVGIRRIKNNYES